MCTEWYSISYYAPLFEVIGSCVPFLIFQGFVLWPFQRGFEFFDVLSTLIDERKYD